MRDEYIEAQDSIQLEWSSLHAESEGFSGILNTRAGPKDGKEGKTGEVGVEHCDQERAVKIL